MLSVDPAKFTIQRDEMELYSHLTNALSLSLALRLQKELKVAASRCSAGVKQRQRQRQLRRRLRQRLRQRQRQQQRYLSPRHVLLAGCVLRSVRIQTCVRQQQNSALNLAKKRMLMGDSVLLLAMANLKSVNKPVSIDECGRP